MAFFATLSGFLLRPMMSGDKGGRRKEALQLLKARLDPDHAFLSRDDDHFVHQEKLTRRDSDASAAGTTAARGTLAAVHWREWRWTTPAAVGDCTWGQVRWRFYDNGRIVFQAEMDNDVGSFKLGVQQGHRIELRTTDGCLLGAWRAAFFVRRYSGIAHYPATVVEEFPLIQQHFDELAERQSGSCFHR
ncbi:hypothetical protein [Acuticoccus sp. I52.16.1]|uniref:hypothetical protein n=1 Tax=Acuticoccus sp. I52.16.1 TaxID=2928472 RepID=UPI001FCFCD6B|nr:hypothetical protein [Acuticoccus sp. I52.16.1]UOM35769.1 hypothetical protein MRB58_06080 [Acuticoccus sp. I52.16.1]